LGSQKVIVRQLEWPNKSNQLGHFTAWFELCQKKLAQFKPRCKIPVIAGVIASGCRYWGSE